MIKKKPTYEFDDPEYISYAQQQELVEGEILKKQQQIKLLEKADTLQIDASGIPVGYSSASQISELKKEIAELAVKAQQWQVKKEAKGAVLTQGGVNTQAKTAGEKAAKDENLLVQNIQQELQGRVARNLFQAEEAQSKVGKQYEAALGQQAARAGQAGYAASSGTAGAMAGAAASKTAADRAAIEDYRLGLQNLLMGQSGAAAGAAESLIGAINKGTTDWGEKSTTAVSDVTGNLLTNVEQLTGTPGYTGDVYADPGIAASQAAVDTALDTWSLTAYMDVLDTLTSHSANKATWEKMLLEQAGTPTNPYGQYDTAISPLTPVAGTQSNLLAAAAAAGEDDTSNVYTSSLKLSGKKKSKGLI